MTRSQALAVIAVFAIAIYAATARIASLWQYVRTIPRCQEDAMLIGTGQFEGGAWTAYECGPAVDDYLP